MIPNYANQQSYKIQSQIYKTEIWKWYVQFVHETGSNASKLAHSKALKHGLNKIISVGKGLSKYNVVISRNALTHKNVMVGLKDKNKTVRVAQSV